MNAKRLATTLLVVLSLVAVGSGAASAAVATPTDAGATADACMQPPEDVTTAGDSDVGTQCSGGCSVDTCWGLP